MRAPFVSIDWLHEQSQRHGFALVHGTLTATCTLFAVVGAEMEWVLSLMLWLLVPSQVCLIALWGTLSDPPMPVRAARAAFWMASLYFCLIVPASLNPFVFGRGFPLLLILAMSVLTAAAALPAVTLRIRGWRMVQERRSSVPTDLRPFQFRLYDLLRGITILCVFMGFGAATIPRLARVPFAYWPGDSNADIVELLVGGGLCLGLPMGLCANLAFWSALAQNEEQQRALWISGLILVGALLLIPMTIAPFGMGSNELPEGICGVTFGFGIPMFVNASILRAFGWRLVRTSRLNRPPRSA